MARGWGRGDGDHPRNGSGRFAGRGDVLEADEALLLVGAAGYSPSRVTLWVVNFNLNERKPHPRAPELRQRNGRAPVFFSEPSGQHDLVAWAETCRCRREGLRSPCPQDVTGVGHGVRIRCLTEGLAEAPRAGSFPACVAGFQNRRCGLAAERGFETQLNAHVAPASVCGVGRLCCCLWRTVAPAGESTGSSCAQPRRRGAVFRVPCWHSRSHVQPHVLKPFLTSSLGSLQVHALKNQIRM